MRERNQHDRVMFRGDKHKAVEKHQNQEITY